MLNDFCGVSKSEYDDFVGLKFEDGRPKVTFPRGFRHHNDESQTRKDIVRLLAAIQRFSGRQEGSLTSSLVGDVQLTFPIRSYQYILKALFSHTQDHVFQVLRVQAVHWNGYIHSLGD